MADGQVVYDVVFKEDGSSLSSLESKAKSTDASFTKMAGAFTLATGVFALLKPVASGLINQFADFEQSFAKVNTLLPTGTTNLASYKDGIMKVSKETGFATSELADGLYEAISAGVKPTMDGAEAMTFLSTSAKLAKGGFTSSASAVDTLTTVLNGYKMETSQATEVSDQLIAVQNYGKTTVDQLSKSLGNVVPVASAMGVGFDQVGTSLAILTSNGIQTAEATTALRSIMSQVGNSTTEMGKTFEKASGKSFQQFIKEGGTVAQALEMVKAEAERTSTPIGKIVPQEAIAGFSVLSSTGGKFDEVLIGIQNSSGATDDAFEKATRNMKDQWNKFVQNFTVSTAGLFTPVIDGITNTLTEFNKFSNTPFGTFVSQVLVGVAGIVFAFAGLVAGIATFQLMLPAITGAISVIGAVLGAITLPIIAIGVAIAGLVALIVMNWDLIVAKTTELWNAMSPVFMNLKAQFDALVPAVMNMVNNVIKFLTDMWVLAQPIIDFFKQMLVDAFNFLVANLPPMMQAIGDAFFAMVNFIITAVNFLLPVIKALADFFMAYVWPVVKTAFEGIRDTITVIFKVLVDLFNSFWTIVTGIFKTFTALLKGDWQGVWDGIKQICDGALRWLTALIGGALSIIMSIFVAVFNNIKAFVSSIFSGIWSVVSSIMSSISSTISGFIDSIKNFFTNGFNSAKDAVQDALNGVKGIIGGFVNVGKDLILGMVEGIKSVAGKVANAAKDVAQGALDSVKGLLGIHSPSRVFRDEIGVMLGKGMSIGIDKSSKEVDKSAKALAESAIKNAKIDSLVGKSSLSDSIASRLSATVPLTSRNSSIGALNLTVNSNSVDAGQVFTEMQSKLLDQIDNYLGGQYAY